MCHMVYLATDCADDLSPQATEWVRFEKPMAEKQTPYPRTLKHAHKWFVGSRSGCSCTFRHFLEQPKDFGFEEPQEWWPEEEDDINATKQLYAVLKSLVRRGHQVQLIDCWSGDEGKEAVEIEVSLSHVSADQFRLSPGCLFNLKP